MQCAKCKTENPESAAFCIRCHTPLKYTCPSCKNVQLHGGKCEKCGVDFAKYAAMLVFRAQSTVQSERAQAKDRGATWKRILLIPLDGGISLVWGFLKKLRGR
jgi:hypothetical protein